MKKRIFLTGASGTVGYEALKQLHQQKEKYEITVFDVKSKTAEKKFKPFQNDITIHYGSITDAEKLNKIGKDIDVAIHLAAIIPPLADEKPELSYEVNVTGTQNLIKALEVNSPNAFLLYSSSISVYGDRLENPNILVEDDLTPSEGDAYAVTKIHAEQAIQNSLLNWSIFRLGAIMGGHKMSKLMFHQPLNTSMEIATPEDTARAFVKAIEKQPELSKKIFNLGGGESCRISYKAFLERSFDIFGLGNLNFAPKAFAEKNFHCGFYADGDVLENILKFRQDDLEAYFLKEQQKVSTAQKMATSVFKTPIKYYLQKQSEPLAAYQKQDQKLIHHFFN